MTAEELNWHRWLMSVMASVIAKNKWATLSDLAEASGLEAGELIGRRFWKLSPSMKSELEAGKLCIANAYMLCVCPTTVVRQFEKRALSEDPEIFIPSVSSSLRG